jgi:hypothetical protein
MIVRFAAAVAAATLAFGVLAGDAAAQMLDKKALRVRPETLSGVA